MLSSFNFDSVLSQNSLDALRIKAINDPFIFLNGDSSTKSLDALVDEFHLELVKAPVSIGISLDLKYPDGSSWECNGDRENVFSMHSAFTTLTLATATDERIWVSLAFGYLREYADARWPMSRHSADKTSLSKGLLSKRFAATSRIRWRENSISRLWWLGHYAESFEGIDSSNVADVMFMNSDALYNLLGRPAIANDRKLAAHVIASVHNYYFGKEVRQFDRNNFRKFLKELDLRSGRYLLGALDEVTLEKLVADSFEKYHSL